MRIASILVMVVVFVGSLVSCKTSVYPDDFPEKRLILPTDAKIYKIKTTVNSYGVSFETDTNLADMQSWIATQLNDMGYTIDPWVEFERTSSETYYNSAQSLTILWRLEDGIQHTDKEFNNETPYRYSIIMTKH